MPSYALYDNPMSPMSLIQWVARYLTYLGHHHVEAKR